MMVFMVFVGYSCFFKYFYGSFVNFHGFDGFLWFAIFFHGFVINWDVLSNMQCYFNGFDFIS